MPVSRRPEPLWPATSASEWDAKGQLATSLLIAELTSTVGCGVSGMARCWAGRIAVTEHITGPSTCECRPRARGRQKGHADPGVTSAWAARLIKAVAGGTPGHFMDGLRVSGAVCPLGGVVRPRRVVRFARLIHRHGRVLSGPSVRAACGGNLKPALVATHRGAA
jgi:hypothetical protein